MNRPLRLTECFVGGSECSPRILWLFRVFSRCLRCILADRQQCFGNPLAAVGDRFIVPANMNVPTKWGTEMRIR